MLITLLVISACTSDILSVTDDPVAGSGDNAPDGSIGETEFTGNVSVVFGGSEAVVTGANGLFSTVINGNDVAITYTGGENVIYTLSGSASEGSFKLYSDVRQAVKLSDLTLTNPSGAAIDIQSHHLTYMDIEGSCTLSDGTSAAYSTGNEDCKGVIFSEGSLVFSGSGSLTVSAVNSKEKSGIVSDDHITFAEGPSIAVSTSSGAGHGIKVNEYVLVSGGSLNINAKAAYKSGIKADDFFGMTGGTVTINNSANGGKGLRAGDYDYDEKNHKIDDSYITGGVLRVTTTGSEVNDESAKGIKIGYKESATKAGWPGGGGNNGGNYVYAGNLKISGGSVYVSCTHSEGLEAKGDLTINGGQIYAYSGGDDAINCQGQMTINGGYVCVYSTGNDALDSNGDMKIYGGFVMAICTRGTPEVGLDANTEGGYKLYIYEGATVVAYGGLESGYSSGQTVYSMSASSGWNALWNGSSFIAAFKCPANVSSFAVCAPSLSTTCYKGVSMSGNTFCEGCWAVDGISGGTEVTLDTYSGGSSGTGGGNWPGGSGGGSGPGGSHGWH